MTFRDALAILRVNPKTLTAACRSGQIKARKRKRRWEIIVLPFASRTLIPTELAAALGVSRRFVLRLCKEGRFKCAKVGKQWRIDKDDGAALIRRRVNGQ